MARERTTTIRCAETGCTETSTYAYTSQREYTEIHTSQRNHPWKCTRHRRPDEVLRLDNPEITTVLVASQVMRGNPARSLPGLYWLSESSGSGSMLEMGPGFKANDAPEVHAGLTVARNPRLWDRDGSAGFNVPLTDGTDGLGYGFGFTAYVGEQCDTESEVWQRYHAAQAHADSPLDCRRRMTEVRITGGTEGFGPGRSDRIMIRRWNENGVCDETVIAFDNGNDACVG